MPDLCCHSHLQADLKTNTVNDEAQPDVMGRLGDCSHSTADVEAVVAIMGEIHSLSGIPCGRGLLRFQGPPPPVEHEFLPGQTSSLILVVRLMIPHPHCSNLSFYAQSFQHRGAYGSHPLAEQHHYSLLSLCSVLYLLLRGDQLSLCCTGFFFCV